MAFTQLAQIQARSTPRALPAVTDPPQTVGISPPVTIPAGTQRVTFRLTSDNWPTGTGSYLLYGLDLLRSGDTEWQVFAPPAQINEGAVNGKTGAMPEITWAVAQQYPPITTDCQLRARYAVPAGSMRFGLEWELA